MPACPPAARCARSDQRTPVRRHARARGIRAARQAMLLALLLLLALGPAGCSMLPSMLGGSTDVVLVLDGDQVHQATLPKGSVLTLDMRDPGQSGYVFVGVAFNAEQLRWDGLEPQPGKRMRYVFATLARGESEILVKIRRPDPGYRPEVFKRVQVRIE